MRAGGSRGGCVTRRIAWAAGRKLTIPVSVSPPVGVLALGAVSWVTTVPGCFRTLLSVLKSFSSCNGLGR